MFREIGVSVADRLSRTTSRIAALAARSSYLFAWYSFWRVPENQFVLPQIDEHYVELIYKIHTQQTVDGLSQASGNPARVHGENFMIPPKYGPDRQRSFREDAVAGPTGTLFAGDGVHQRGCGDVD